MKKTFIHVCAQNYATRIIKAILPGTLKKSLECYYNHGCSEA